MGNIGENVTVGVVTFNRIKYLVKLLKRLSEIEDISTIIIFDNNSKDGTLQFLKQFGKFISIKYNQINQTILNNGKKLMFYPSTKNLGGAYGFSKLIKLFLKRPTSYLWLMDDDVLPEKDCLKNLLANIDQNTGVCIPNRTDRYFQDVACVNLNLDNPLKCTMSKRKKYVRNFNNLSYLYVEDFPFEGPLFRRDIVEKAGTSDSQYFIICDDTDYAYKIRKYTKIKFIVNAKLHRQLTKVTRNNTTKFNWKYYYSLRNDILFIKKYGKNWSTRVISPILLWVYWSAFSIRHKQWSNFSVINRAFYDGEKGIRGETVIPGSINQRVGAK